MPSSLTSKLSILSLQGSALLGWDSAFDCITPPPLQRPGMYTFGATSYTLAIIASPSAAEASQCKPSLSTTSSPQQAPGRFR